MSTSNAKSVLNRFHESYENNKADNLSLDEAIGLAAKDPSTYENAAQGMLRAIGKPQIIETRLDPRLSVIHANANIQQYAAFRDFYGMEKPIKSIVNFFRNAALGLEESKQVLYLLGPVGSAKSSLAEKLKELMQKTEFYALCHRGNVSPVHESMLGLFNPKYVPNMEETANYLMNDCGIPAHVLERAIPSPWAEKRLKEAQGDLSEFSVRRMSPSILKQIAIAKTEPGDENNQDISSLVGKLSIHKLEDFDQDDPDAYSYSGGLCLANRGILEFVEMFKAPIKVLHPLLTATQERNYKGTEGFGAIPWDGVVLAHSNESEWLSFRNNKNNEAFLDRIRIVKVPYNLRVTEEARIYKKLLTNSELSQAPCAPQTLETLARFMVLSRLKDPENSSIYSKMRVYDGENLKNTDPKAKSLQEYKDLAGEDEGMTGLSTRFAFKILSATFNKSAEITATRENPEGEVSADPLLLMQTLEAQIIAEEYPPETEARYLSFIKEYLEPKFMEELRKDIHAAYLESYSEYGQNIFDRYVTYADMWIQDQDFRDPNTGEILDRSALNEELEKIEKPAGISNPKDFRNEVVNFALRVRARDNGANPKWTSYEKLRTVIEKRMFSKTEEILPVISFNGQANAKDAKKHEDFINRMTEKGYTGQMTQRLCNWYLQKVKHG